MLNSAIIKQRAAALGFTACGLSEAHPVDADAQSAFDGWLADGCHAGMAYMENHRELRLDPCRLHPGTRTVLSFALPYAPAENADAPISWYALGPDYHDVVRSLLQQMGIEGRICVDTAPMLEKYWAVQCGLGWIGRNHQLVIPGRGSAFFLGEILSTEEADFYDTPHTGHCGDCRLCERACPTNALRSDGRLDARLCLSYQTIENRGPITVPVPADGRTYIYGCDRCLRACPHLQGAPCQTHFPSNPEIGSMGPDDWTALDAERYRRLFRGSAVKRAKYEGLMRNIRWAIPQPGQPPQA